MRGEFLAFLPLNIHSPRSFLYVAGLSKNNWWLGTKLFTKINNYVVICKAPESLTLVAPVGDALFHSVGEIRVFVVHSFRLLPQNVIFKCSNCACSMRECRKYSWDDLCHFSHHGSEVWEMGSKITPIVHTCLHCSWLGSSSDLCPRAEVIVTRRSCECPRRVLRTRTWGHAQSLKLCLTPWACHHLGAKSMTTSLITSTCIQFAWVGGSSFAFSTFNNTEGTKVHFNNLSLWCNSMAELI